jgi:hypothetical protein
LRLKAQKNKTLLCVKLEGERRKNVSKKNRPAEKQVEEKIDEKDKKDEDRGLKRAAALLNKITDFSNDLWKFFDFSKTHTVSSKILNVFAIFSLDLVYLFFFLLFLTRIANYDSEQIRNIMTPLSVSMASGPLPFSLMNNPLWLFFLACVMAPLWEEFCFRLAPIRLAQLLTGIAKNTGAQMSIVGITAVAFAIWFGWCHGYGVISILIQGVGGLFFAWIYLKNNNSYWSCVAAHAIWNFMVIFGLPSIMSIIV